MCIETKKCWGTEPLPQLSESVRELAETIRTVEGIQHRGVVLAFLMRLKQICNHPAQWRGDGDYDPRHSGKFTRLAELCNEMAQRQEKALILRSSARSPSLWPSTCAACLAAPALSCTVGWP